MKHYGDIKEISGYDVPVVDVITGGSPCQDLSVAGKRAGLAGERSGLFMEQIRVVKEMRERDRRAGRAAWAIRPRYMVWENVPGAFSSGNPKGADFAAVIEEIIKVCEPGADLRVPVPSNGWTKSGCYYAEDGQWSIAWRVHDAQFWGVPQRRKRIALVADFGGLTAPEILFERKGLRGHPAESGAQGQGTSAGTEEGAGSAVSFQERAGKPGGGKGLLMQGERTGALSTLNNQSVLQATSVDEKMGNTYIGEDIGNTLGARDYKQPQAVFTAPVPIHDKATRYKGGGAGRHDDGGANLLGIGKPDEPTWALSTSERHSVYASAVDVYNQSIDGEIAASVTAAVGGGRTQPGPK